MATAALLVGAGIVITARRDGGSDPSAVLTAVLSGVALVELSVVLMTARRADRAAAEVALYDLESARWQSAEVEDLREEVERLRGDLTLLTARLQASGQHAGTPQGGRST